MPARRQDGSAAGRNTRNFRSNMHRRQDGSAAGRNTRRNQIQWGKISFESTVTATTLPPDAQLVQPAKFVNGHADKMHEFVTLKNVENNRVWTVRIGIRFLENRYGNPPLVFFYGHGWRAFTIANDLAIGDQLIFVLVAHSKFHVSIFRGGENSSLCLEETKIPSQKPIPKRKETNPATKLRPGPQLGCGIPPNGCEGSGELARAGTLRAKETGIATEARDPSQSPSRMNSHGFKPLRCDSLHFGINCQCRQMIPHESSQQERLSCQLVAMTKVDMMKTVGVSVHIVFNE